LVAGLIALAVFGLFARASSEPFTGDEPHYVAYAANLAYDFDFEMSDAYTPERTAHFYPGLGPHTLEMRGPDGGSYSWHGPALPVLLAPAVRIFDFDLRAVRGTMMLLAAGLGAVMYSILQVLYPRRPFARWAGWAIATFSLPVLVYSAQIYPELPISLVIAIGVRLLLGKDVPRWRLYASATAASLTPWFGVRYSALGVALVVAVLARSVQDNAGPAPVPLRAQLAALTHPTSGVSRQRAIWRTAAPAIVPGMISFAVFTYTNWAWFNSVSPLAVWNAADTIAPNAESQYFEISYLYQYGVGNFFGRGTGLLVFAPAMLLAIIAIPLVIRRAGPVFGVLIALTVGGYALMVCAFGSQGFSPLTRYLVVLVPFAAVPIAELLASTRWLWRGATAGLAILGALIALYVPARYVNLYVASDQFPIVEDLEDMWPDTGPLGAAGFASAPSTLPAQTGDVETIGGTTLRVAREGSDDAGLISFGPYAGLDAGSYNGTVELGRGTTGPASVAITFRTIDGRELATAAVDGEDLPRGGELLPVDVPFVLPEDGIVEAQVFYDGSGTLYEGAISATQVAPLEDPSIYRDVGLAVLWGLLVLTSGLLLWHTAGTRRVVHRD
jgi:hypothetical protein